MSYLNNFILYFFLGPFILLNLYRICYLRKNPSVPVFYCEIKYGYEFGCV